MLAWRSDAHHPRQAGSSAAHTQVRREPAPRLGGLARLDFIRRLLQEPVNAFTWLHRTHGPMVALRVPGYRVVSITDLGDIQRVMKDNYQNYSKGSQYTDMEPVWGRDNLLSAHGEVWARQRRVCGPEFRPGRSPEYQEIIVRRADELLASYEQSARTGQVRRLYDDMKYVIMHILCDDWFGMSAKEDTNHMARLLARITDITASRVLVPINLPMWVPTPGHVRYQRLLGELRVLVGRMLRERKNQARDPSATRTDLLDRMLLARQAETGKTMTDDEVYDNIIVFLLAAYETPSLGWTLYFVGKHPRVAEALRDEVQTVLGDRAPTVEDLAQLKYVRMCIDEAMRLFAVSPIMAREALADDELATCRIEAGTTVAIPACVIHHDPALWPEPRRYRPERFADPERVHPFSYMPFGQGPRACIGGALARQMMITIVAMLFQRFSYVLEPGYRPRPHDKLKPYPSGSVPVRLTRLAA